MGSLKRALDTLAFGGGVALWGSPRRAMVATRRRGGDLRSLSLQGFAPVVPLFLIDIVRVEKLSAEVASAQSQVWARPLPSFRGYPGELFSKET
jgi:hypothetical protein